MRKYILYLSIFLSFVVYSKDISLEIIGNSKTKKSIIRKFFPDKLQSEVDIEKGKMRLESTNWFSQVNSYLIGDEDKKLILEVKEGYDKRYSGGNAFLGYGRVNYNGRGDSYFFELGLDRQTINYSRYFFADNIEYGVYLGNKEKNFFIDNRFIYRYGGNINLGLKLKPYSKRDSDYNKLHNEFESTIFIDYNNSKGNLFNTERGYNIKVSYSNYYEKNINRVKAEVRNYFTPVKNLHIANRLKYSIQNDDKKESYYLLNIGGDNGIRNNNIKEVEGNSIYLNNLEFRLDIGNLISFVPRTMQGLIFIDYGRAFMENNELNFSKGKVAYGGEIRILLEEPVYLPIRFIGGVSKNRESEFGISVLKPF